MGRSFFKPDAAHGTEDLTHANPVYHQPSSTWYSMLQREDGLYQRRWRMGYDGKESLVQDLKVDYVMGSGNHARTYLHRTARGTLLELPLGWYPEGGGTWAMGPGNDGEEAPAPRTIAYECMFCHNAYPKIPAGNEASGSEPVYSGALPEGIDCQRCHGPGAAHAKAATAATPNLEAIRAAIVNPARLTAERGMEVCMQCHLQTTSMQLPHAIQKFDRGPFSYKAGEPLEDFVLHFDRQGGNPEFEIVSSAYRLRESPCFLRSQGKLTCTSCHNPHEETHGEAGVAAYDRVCTGCHAQTASAADHPGKRDCAGCHMPKRRTADVIHAVMTDHRIQKRGPQGALDERKERTERGAGTYQGEVVPYYPASGGNALYTAVAQVTQRSNLKAGLPRLAAEIEKQKPERPEFYIELGQAWLGAAQPAKAVAAFEEAVKRAPASPIALLNLADGLTQTRQFARAVATLQRALASAPRDPLLHYQMGIAQAGAGHQAEAIAAFEKAVALDPELAEAHNLLGATLAARGDLARAEKELMRALEIYPDHAEAQANLGHLFAARGDFRQAAFYLDQAVKRKPSDPEVRTNYAVSLAAMGKFAQAKEQIDAAVQADPKSAEARNMRGSLLEQMGAREEALAEFLEAVRLRPEFGVARVNAARMLAAKGDVAGARAQLQRAITDPDPRVRSRAAAMLSSMK